MQKENSFFFSFSNNCQLNTNKIAFFSLNRNFTVSLHSHYTQISNKMTITKMKTKGFILLLVTCLLPLSLSAQTNDQDEEQADTTGTVVSHIEIYNAFSPNDDGINDKLTVKSSATKGIVEFRAIIYNRWGQKLYEWTDINDGWDGTYNGTPVKQGTYFVLVKAKGSDGQVHTIRRDVNLLRGYLNDEQSQEQ